MKQKSNNQKILIFTILAAFFSLLLANWLIQRVLERPFINDVNLRDQQFYSPPNMIFLTSIIIIILGFFIKLFIKCKSSNNFDGDEIEECQEQQIQIENNNDSFDKQRKTQIRKDKKIDDKLENNLKVQLLYHFKVALPKFLEIICFLYGIGYLGFPTMLFTAIVLKLGFCMLYQVIFTNQSKKLFKLFIITLALLAYALFHFTLRTEREKKSQQQIIYGYLFVFGMCITNLIRKFLEICVQLEFQNISAFDQTMYQAKFNFISAYLLAVYLKQEIYGLVFAALHYQFIIKIILLSVLLFTGILLKTFLRKQFGHQLSQFTNILQKNVSIFISLSYFSSGVQRSIILVLGFVSLLSFVNFLLKLTESKQNDKTSFIQQKSFIFDSNVENEILKS